MTIERRSFLAAAIAASPAALVAQSTKAKASPKAVRVARGEDRLGEHHTHRLEHNSVQSIDER